ncbi:MAG: hypothetical protein ACOVO0_01505 [Burkholderiaceae bacterium]
MTVKVQKDASGRQPDVTGVCRNVKKALHEGMAIGSWLTASPEADVREATLHAYMRSFAANDHRFEGLTAVSAAFCRNPGRVELPNSQ